MIKIEIVQKEEIFGIHLRAVSNWSLPIIDFYIVFLNALLKVNFIHPDTTELPIDTNTAISIIKSFIKSKKKKSKVQITQKLILGFLKGKNNLPISVVSGKSALKDYYEGLTFIKSNFRAILTDIPENLMIINNELNKLIKKEIEYPSFKTILNKVFNYEKLISDGFRTSNGEIWDSYQFTRLLDIEVCPYCNRNWIMTVINGNYINQEGKPRTRVVNPQIDHFFSQSTYPLLQLSIYNMVPSCDICNSRLKHKVPFNLDDYIHPYLKGYNSNVRFKATALSYEASVGLKGDYSISLLMDGINETDKRCISNNHILFEIDRIYESHGDVISDLFRKRHLFSAEYMNVLRSTFNCLQEISDAELFKIAFGTYYGFDSYKKRPFSKLIKDISLQLNLIKD